MISSQSYIDPAMHQQRRDKEVLNFSILFLDNAVWALSWPTWTPAVGIRNESAMLGLKLYNA